MSKSIEKRCRYCRSAFRTTRVEGSTSKEFCSSECRQRWHYQRRKKVLVAAGIGQEKIERARTKPKRRRGKWVFIPQ